MAITNASNAPALRARDRLLLLLPLAVGLAGVGPLLFASAIAPALGLPGNDRFFYWLAGAAFLGYGVALAAGIAQSSWRAVRNITVAALVFALASLYALAVDASGPLAPAIAVAAILQVVITAWLLYAHRMTPAGPRDMGGGLLSLGVLWLAIAAATFFGLLGAFAPLVATGLFGYRGTELFLYRLAGAATLGYAVMGLFNARSQRWSEVRLPLLMAIVFNGVSFFAAIAAILQGDPLFMPALVAVATFAVTAPMTYTFLTTKSAA